MMAEEKRIAQARFPRLFLAPLRGDRRVTKEVLCRANPYVRV
jgi:hypothetical protein